MSEQSIDTVEQSKAKGVQFCADTIVMMNYALRHAGDQELSQRAEDELRVIMLGKLGAKYWKQDVEEAKQHSAAVLDGLRDELEEADNCNTLWRQTDGR